MHTSVPCYLNRQSTSMYCALPNIPFNCTQLHTKSTPNGTIHLFQLSISCQFPPPLLSGSRPPRSSISPISPGQGDKEDTAESFTFRARVTFQPCSTAGRIFAKRLVLMDLQPGIVSDFLLSVFHANPTLKTVVLRLNNADIENHRAGVDPYIPKGKHDKSDTGYYVGQGDGDTLLFASGKPSPSEMQARGFTKAQLVYQERILPAKHMKLYPVQSLLTWSPIAF